MRWRTNFLIVCFFIFYSLLFSKIYNIQLNKSDYYLNRAESQQKAIGSLEPTRGNIYFSDKNGNSSLAAFNKDYGVIYAVPQETFENYKDIAGKLEPIINLSIEEIENKLNKKKDLYELLVEKATSEQMEKIKSLGITGIYTDIRPFRSYPFSALAAHLIGFTSSAQESEILKYGNSYIGRYGLEAKLDKSLRGKNGYVEKGNFVSSEAGENIFLTLDINIQTQAEEILKKLIEEHKATGGTILVEEPKTGKILAMASNPNFDPNNYSKYDIKNFLNPAVQAVYEPGSVFKVITMAAGIDSGKITPDTTYVDSGSVVLNERTIKNWDLRTYGKQTMTNVLENSINTGAVFAQRKTGPDIFYNYLVKFGFNDLNGISLPGEVKGNLNNLRGNKEIDFATASFGQGVAVTPIQLMSAISAIANNGVLMKPLILKEEAPQVIRRVVSSETAKAVANMMILAVNKNKLAVVENYSVAGKTGTAFIPDFGKGKYTDDVINTYVGFIKSDFAILIKLDRAYGSPLAGQTVVPAFRNLAQFILNYYNIAPDKL
mgnify:CR=1 FL=1